MDRYVPKIKRKGHRPTAFQPGHEKKAGRPPGSQNKLPATVKEAILTAIERYGSNGKGRDGMIGYFFRMCRDQVLICRLVERILPLQVTGKNDGPIQVFSLPPDAIKHLNPEQLAVLELTLSSIGSGQLQLQHQPNGKVIEGKALEYASAIGDEVPPKVKH